MSEKKTDGIFENIFCCLFSKLIEKFSNDNWRKIILIKIREI